MQNPLIVLGATAYGALVSWAVTADHYEQKLKEKEQPLTQVVNNFSYYDSASDRPGSDWPEDVKMGVETNADDLEARLDSGEIEIIREQDGTLRTRNLQVEEGEIAVSDAENPRGDETSEAGEADETEEKSLVPPGETVEETRARLKSVINEYTVGDDGERQLDVGQIAHTMNNTPVGPYVISRALFSSDPDEGDLYEKETVKYFKPERVVIDDDEELIDDIQNVLGWKNLNRFGDESGDADIVFIRNPRLETDYEVELAQDDEQLPLHVKYSMTKPEFQTMKAAGVLKLRPEDMD